MEFDERLGGAFDALADSLHQELTARLAAVRTELSESVQADRDAAIAEAVGEARAAADRAAREARDAADQQVSAQIDDAVARARTDVRAEVAASLEASARRLVDAIRAIDSSQTLSEILDVLVGAATTEVGRAAIFLPQDSSLKGWRLVGFDLLGGDGSEIELPGADGGMIAEAAESAQLIRLNPGQPRTALLPAFVDLPEQRGALAVPLVMSGQVFAVLYVDEGKHEPVVRESWPATIEVLARHAARALEAITATRLAQVAELVAR